MPKVISRRKFITNSILLIGGTAAYLAGSGALFYNAALQNKKSGKSVLRKPQSNLVLLGNAAKFDKLTEVTKVDYQTEIEDGWVTQSMKGFVYITKNEKNELLIMSPICTHLGCTVPFASNEEKGAVANLEFKCPCHGGEYDKMGKNIGGPPPRPLDVFQPIVQERKLYFDHTSPIQRKS